MLEGQETAGESLLRWGALGATIIIGCLVAIGVVTAIMGV
jgi:hypothetical protein